MFSKPQAQDYWTCNNQADVSFLNGMVQLTMYTLEGVSDVASFIPIDE